MSYPYTAKLLLGLNKIVNAGYASFSRRRRALRRTPPKPRTGRDEGRRVYVGRLRARRESMLRPSTRAENIIAA